MGTKLTTTGDAVDYLREQAWRAIECGRGNRAEKLGFCADVIAKMQQEICDLEDLTAEMMEEPSAVSASISTLLDVRRKLEDVLGPEDRINLAELAYDAIDMMLEDALFDGSGWGPEGCDCPSCGGASATAPQEADKGPSRGSRLPMLPESETGPVAASGEPLADFMMAMQDVVDAYAEHLSSVEIVGAIEMVKDEALGATRLGKSEVYFA
jgi:hypothetical protein